MKNNKKKNKVMLLLVLLLAIAVGYAAISTQLKITGSATVTKQTWNVYWDTPVVTTGSKSMTAPTRGADSGDPANTKLTWSVTLDLPGDFYEFTVDAVNAGTIDAMIAVNGITSTVSPSLPTNPDYIKYSITYADGSTPAQYHLLAKADTSTTPSTPTKQKYKVRVYYDENAATRDTINNMSATTTYTFTFGVTYTQATDDAIDIRPPVIDSCPGCVFTYLSEIISYDTDISGNPQTRTTITNFTDDYRTIQKDNTQRKVFPGLVLDNQNKPIKSYICGIEDYGLETETAYCLETSQSDSNDAETEESLAIFNNNKALLQSLSVFDNKCSWGQEVSYSYMKCNNYDIDLYSTAVMDVTYGNEHCSISYDGDIHCWEY